jgi:hypothetical protein
MDLSERPLLIDLLPAGDSSRGAGLPAGGSSPESPESVAQLGREVAAVLSSALERVNLLATRGLADPAGLRALREEIERARRAAIAGQQLPRLASGRIRVALEPLNLSAALHDALQQRGAEIEARRLQVRQMLAPATVSSDPTLLFSLLQALLDWAFDHAAGLVALRIEQQPWPARALLVCRFPHRTPWGAPPTPGTPPALDSLAWRVLHQSATLLAVGLRRQADAEICTLTLDFPDPLPPPAVSPPEPAPASEGWAPNSQPLAGHHVLVLAARRDLRRLVIQVLQPMGLMLDFVASVEEAREFCRGGLPHALLFEAALGGERLARLRAELLAEEPRLGWVQLSDEGPALQVQQQFGRKTRSVGAEAAHEGLPAALMAELAGPAA